MCCQGKSWLQPIFTIDSHRAVGLVNLKTMGEVVGRIFLIYYSLGTNSTVKSFKQLGVAKSTI